MILARCVDLWNVSWPVDLRAWKYQNGLDDRLLAVSLESHEIQISIRCLSGAFCEVLQ